MLRFAVKDIVDVAGVETGLGNRSYRKLYPSRSSSARCIDRLIDAGAILVGKTKTTQFAEGEAPIQWYEFPTSSSNILMVFTYTCAPELEQPG